MNGPSLTVTGRALTVSEATRKRNPDLWEKQQPQASAPAAGEAELHYAIMDFCRDRGWLFLHGSMAARTHRTLGEPDFVIAANNGRVLFVECKSRVGKLSPVQLAFKVQAERLGHTVHVVRSMEEFLAIV